MNTPSLLRIVADALWHASQCDGTVIHVAGTFQTAGNFLRDKADEMDRAQSARNAGVVEGECDHVGVTLFSTQWGVRCARCGNLVPEPPAPAPAATTAPNCKHETQHRDARYVGQRCDKCLMFYIPKNSGPAQPVSEPERAAGDSRIDSADLSSPASPVPAPLPDASHVPPMRMLKNAEENFLKRESILPMSAVDRVGLACQHGKDPTLCGECNARPPAPDASQGKACWHGWQYKNGPVGPGRTMLTGWHCNKCGAYQVADPFATPAAPPAQVEGFKIFSLPSNTDKDAEHAVRFPDAGRVATDGKRYVLAEPTTPPESGLRECPFCKSAAIEHAEIPLSDDIACPAHVQCQGCGAMAPATVWNARPSEESIPVPSDDAIHESIEALAEWSDQEPDITGYGGKLLKDAVTNMRAVMAELSRLRSRPQGVTTVGEAERVSVERLMNEAADEIEARHRQRHTDSHHYIAHLIRKRLESWLEERGILGQSTDGKP